jgi:large subunit ribosomal protein L18
MDKKLSRMRRAKRTRMKIKELNMPRLSVARTGQHIYAQLITQGEQGDKVIVSSSTMEKSAKSSGAVGSNIKSAGIIGKLIAEKAIKNGVSKVAFDRAGFKYHGCIKALADAAREAGLEF